VLLLIYSRAGLLHSMAAGLLLSSPCPGAVETSISSADQSSRSSKLTPYVLLAVQGSVTPDKCVVCPAHGTAFDLKTGDVKGEWCPKVRSHVVPPGVCTQL
jgi:hypothetical protein